MVLEEPFSLGLIKITIHSPFILAFPILAFHSAISLLNLEDQPPFHRLSVPPTLLSQVDPVLLIIVHVFQETKHI
jgi:hypothetical protein